jgi:hypothetical protein
MFRHLFYFLGTVVFLIVLDEKVFHYTGVHLWDGVSSVVAFVVWVLKGGS